MTQIIRKFGLDDSGATAIEYGLIAGMIAVVIIGAVLLVHDNLTALYDVINDSLDPALRGK